MRERFYLAEVTGYVISPGGRSADKSRSATDVMILDRIYAHKVVWTTATATVPQAKYNARMGKWYNTRHRRVTVEKRSTEWKREYAAELCARMNADYAEWLAA